MLEGRIKRKTENPTNKFPIIGKIKVGEVKENAKYPTSLDYFRCTGKYESHFQKAYGQKPNVIQVVFISDNLVDSCFERYECRDHQGRLVGRGDGEITEVFDKDVEDYIPSGNMTRDELAKLGSWSTILTLRFVVIGVSGVFGLFQFDTKADKSSIPTIRDTFDTVLTNIGTVINVPFDLCVEKVKSQKPGAKSLYPVVTLVPNISKENQELLAEHLQTGADIKKLGQLTEEKIKQLKS